MENIIGTSAFQKLQQFSDTANRLSGKIHDLDEKKWFDFVVETYRTDGAEKLRAEDLTHWFISNEWDDDTAGYLAKEFINQRRLLSFYDQHR